MKKVPKLQKNTPSSTLISAFFSKRQKLDVSVDAPSTCNDETECKPTDVGDDNINNLCDKTRGPTGLNGHLTTNCDTTMETIMQSYNNIMPV